MLSKEQLEEIEGDLKALRFPKGDKGNLSRYGFYDQSKDEEKRFVDREKGYICTANMKNRPSWAKNLPHYHVFNGESPPNTSAPYSGLEGGALSLKWLKFLMDETISPFRHLIPTVENRDDLEKINAETGLIITDYQQARSGAMLGFIIGSRFAQENNHEAQVWEIMVDGGIDPRIAYQIAANFRLSTDGIVTHTYMQGHTIFYQWPAITSKNWYHGLWPEDQLIGECKKVAGTDAANGAHKHPLYSNYVNAWDRRSIEGNPGFFGFDPKNPMPVDELAAKIEKYCNE